MRISLAQVHGGHYSKNYYNKKSRLLRAVFLSFLLWVKEVVNSDCRFASFMKSVYTIYIYIYRERESQLDMSRVWKCGQKVRKSKHSAQKNAMSDPKYPPYLKNCKPTKKKKSHMRNEWKNMLKILHTSYEHLCQYKC